MRKRAKKLLALLTAVTITVTGVNVPAAQAAKVKVTASKTTLYYNGTSAEKKATVTVKNVKGKKVTYSISKAGKKIVKLGDVSGNKTKKFTVTAKKKGTAKVTVKVAGKKVKTIKFTVKKKTAKATPNPTAAPTQEPTVAPSDEPTVAPTDAPSDEPTVAPTDAPSDAPTATPSDEPVKDKSVVTEIKILNDVALTDGGNRAYVYYDVLDQYGESMRESCSINWSTSPTQVSTDKQVGRLTITNSALAGNFKYGDFIVVTGVHPTSGVSVSKTLTVGLQQQIDTINFEGFVKDNEKNKLLENVGADFDKGTNDYYLLFTAKDQNGNEIDFNSPSFVYNSDVTFTSDNPLLLEVKSNVSRMFTIGDKTYVGVQLKPGMYADKGGEVNITGISTKTGGKVTKNYVIGDAGVLQSLELLAPTGTVCDGESVEFKYVAKTTAGEEVTNYETIVRSTNSLTLNVSEGTLKVSENNDGTAKITWEDTAFNPASIATYGDPKVSDGIARPISISTVVVGGSNNFLQFQVEDIRIPVSASIEDQTVASKGLVEYKAVSNQGYDGNITFTDQYGQTLRNYKAVAFLKYAHSSRFGGNNGGYYSLSIDSTQEAQVYGGPAYGWMNDIGAKDTYRGHGDYFEFGVTFEAKEVTTPNDVATATYKASIVKCNNSTFSGPTLESVGKIDNATVTVVPLNLINAFELSTANKTLRLQTTHGDADTVFAGTTAGSASFKVNPAFTVASDNGNNAKVSVIGKYKGLSLAINNAYVAPQNDIINVASGVMTGIKQNVVAKEDVFDLTAYGNPAKEFALALNVKVDAKQTHGFTDPTVQDLSKSITFKYEAQKANAVSIKTSATPNLTNIASVATLDKVTDQFGNTMNGQTIVYSIQNINESKKALAHVDDSFVVSGNGSSTVSIAGAEIGDEFDVVATVVGTKVTATVHVTVTADAMANITATNAGVTDNDKNLRTNKLQYDR